MGDDNIIDKAAWSAELEEADLIAAVGIINRCRPGRTAGNEQIPGAFIKFQTDRHLSRDARHQYATYPGAKIALIDGTVCQRTGVEVVP